MYITERKNRMILNVVISLLVKGLVPMIFWSEVVNWSVSVLKRNLICVLKNRATKKACSSRKHVVDYSRLLCCIVYAHIYNMRKGKNLMQKLKKCIFLGASNVSNAYKLFNPPTKTHLLGLHSPHFRTKFFCLLKKKKTRKTE